MYRYCLPIFSFVWIFLSPQAGMTTEEQWQSLFNGEDLSGWIVKCKPADQEKHAWRVDQGTILADSMGMQEHDYIWLMTREEYQDFVLRLRFQAYRDSSGNSGVQVRSRYDDKAGWLDGPQVDIHPFESWRTGMMWDETRGMQRWIFPDLPKGKWVDPSMAPEDLKLYFADEGEGWNDLEIRMEGLNLRAVLNGTVITNFKGDGILNDEIHREKNVGIKGHIALQIHTGDQLRIRYKDIRILRLDK